LYGEQAAEGSLRGEDRHMPIEDVRGLFVRGLCGIYDAEHRFLEGQVKMVHKATDHDLQRSIEDHIRQTRQQIGNLEQLFRVLDEEPTRETNEAAEGLAREAEKVIEQARTGTLRDCAIAAAMIEVEHLEMGCYRALIDGARLMMGRSMAVDLLEANLRQEEQTAQRAEASVNELLRKALQAEAPEPEGPIDKIKKVRDRLRGD
jgi:ferritin-like metal-binding protein YciE